MCYSKPKMDIQKKKKNNNQQDRVKFDKTAAEWTRKYAS